MIVTIDGPAGAGKSSVAKALARRLGFRFLDTGAMYRAVTLAAMRRGHDWCRADQLATLTRGLRIELTDDRVLLDGDDVTEAIRATEVTSLVHYAANNPQVRECLVERQRQVAAGRDMVTEGRDQGTVVFPHAELKVFLTASPEERARRRLRDLEKRGESVSLEEVLAQQNQRDQSDSERDVGPLCPAADAVELITDGLTPLQVEERLEQMVRQRQGARGVPLVSKHDDARRVDAARWREFIWRLPKAELHLHLEGTLEPELMFELAQRNRVRLPYASVEEARAAYQFTDLQSFLDAYYEAARVLVTEQDFFDLTWAYLLRAAQQGVRHAEVFVDPQTHAARGVPFATAYYGIIAALDRARRQLDLTSHLLPCFLRHLSADDAAATLKAILPYKSRLIGVGLDSSERDHPPAKFAAVFAEARRLGFVTVAHAGEEGPPDYIRQALDLLGARRIDHGVRCLEDSDLIDRLRRDQVPLTVCPLSNVRLGVVASLAEHPLRRLLDAGLMVTVNSDDPAYFGGYVGDNFLACHEQLGLDADALARLADHSLGAAFLPDERREALRSEVRDVRREFAQLDVQDQQAP